MQTSYSDAPAIGRLGATADSRSFKAVLSRVCEGLVAVGRSVFRTPVYGAPQFNHPHGSGVVYQNPSPAIAVDVDAILASGGASAVTEQVWEGTELNGVVGGGVMRPARKITLVLSSSANWDATNATLRAVDEEGNIVTETLAIPDAGNATVTSVGTYTQVLSLTIPAQSGTGGTFTVGITVLDTVTIADWEGVVPYVPTAGGQFGAMAATGYEFTDGDAVPVMRKGALWVVTEDACVAGGDVYTRIGGTGDMGAFRSDADTSNAVQIPGARWRQNSSAGGLNVLEMF